MRVEKEKGTPMYLCRFRNDTGHTSLGLVRNCAVWSLDAHWASLAALLEWSVGRADLAGELAALVASAAPVAQLNELMVRGALLKPTDSQEVWAAGVTYARSKTAREEESAGSGIYDRVYAAPRPELFFKATPNRTVGPHEPVAVRRDSRWNVPEPELALVINPALELVGFTIGNDMSSRDIEGENPLYLPQAKVYAQSCGLGPGILIRQKPLPAETEIHMEIIRSCATIFHGQTRLSELKRTPEELVEYLFRDNTFPYGCFLLTGAGIVPPDEFTLAVGDEIRITIEPIGTLVNYVTLA